MRSCAPISAALLPDDLLLLDVLRLQCLRALRTDGPERLALTGLETALEVRDRLLERALGVVPELPGLPDRGQDVGAAPQVVEELLLEPADVGDRHVVDLARGA